MEGNLKKVFSFLGGVLAALIASAAGIEAIQRLQGKDFVPPEAIPPRSIRPEDPSLTGKEIWVVLGDSIVYGSKVPESSAWVSVLQENIAARWQDTERLIVNAGIPGETSVMAVWRVSRDVTAYMPKVALVAYGLNDAMLARSIQDRAWERQFWLYYGRFPRSWRTFWEIKERLSPESQSVESAAPRVSPEAFEAAIKAIVRRLQLEGIKVYLLTTPPTDDRFQRAWPASKRDYQRSLLKYYNQIIRNVAKSTKAELIDIFTRFPKHGLDTLIGEDGLHPTPSGHSLISEIVLERLIGDGMLPEPPQMVLKKGG
jgi:lysophospholipase L1-like esterase